MSVARVTIARNVSVTTARNVWVKTARYVRCCWSTIHL